MFRLEQYDRSVEIYEAMLAESKSRFIIITMLLANNYFSWICWTFDQLDRCTNRSRSQQALFGRARQVQGNDASFLPSRS